MVPLYYKFCITTYLVIIIGLNLRIVCNTVQIEGLFCVAMHRNCSVCSSKTV